MSRWRRSPKPDGCGGRSEPLNGICGRVKVIWYVVWVTVKVSVVEACADSSSDEAASRRVNAVNAISLVFMLFTPFFYY